MGMSATRRLTAMLEKVRSVIAIELLAATQGLDFLAPLRTGGKSQAAYELVRNVDRNCGEGTDQTMIEPAEGSNSPLTTASNRPVGMDQLP
jgi:histidine ammonia-lyase